MLTPTNTKKTHASLNVSDMVYIAVFAALIAVCAWISIPTTIPFTLQTFGVFTAVGVLGGRRGTLAVLIYILLGTAGLPVFAGFTGGPGILFGTSGGYILGFLVGALAMWALERVFGSGPAVQIFSMGAALLLCYAFGTVWFLAVYARSSGAVGLFTVLGWCVFPFILPDLVKIALAFFISRRLKRFLSLSLQKH